MFANPSVLKFLYTFYHAYIHTNIIHLSWNILEHQSNQCTQYCALHPCPLILGILIPNSRYSAMTSQYPEILVDTPVTPLLRTESGVRHYILGLIDLFFLRAELVPVVIQTISIITKIIYIYKRTTTGVVSLQFYTHILSPIYLYKHLYLYMSNTKYQRLQKQCGEHLSLSWLTLLMWDVLSSILVFCFCNYTD